MDIQSVIDRAISDPVFAAELLVSASRASRELSDREHGVLADSLPGEAWRALMAHFATDPEELGRLTFDAKTAKAWPGTLGTTTTVTTTTTATSIPCGVTSTTTTTTTTFTTI